MNHTVRNVVIVDMFLPQIIQDKMRASRVRKNIHN
jgi:hypothetical protein